MSPTIELFRGIAAWMVLTSHYAAFIAPSPNILNFLWTGVDFFFVISGFVFGKVIYSSKISLPAYFIRRAFRIYPLYFVSLLLYFIVTIEYPDKRLFLFKHLFFLHTTESVQEAFFFNPAYWSLPVEVEFYLCVPLLAFWFARSKNALYWLFGLSLLATVWIAAHAMPLNQPDFYTIARFHLPAILLEFWVGIYLYHISTEKLFTTVQKIWVLICGVILLSMLIMVFLGQQGEIDGHLFSKAYFNFLAAVGYGCILFTFLEQHRWLTLCAVMGNLSYGVYLFHHLIPKLFSLLGWQLSGITAYISYSIGVIALSILLHYIVERPARHFGRYLSQYWRN